MLEFCPSKPLTVGMELEFQLVNAHTYDLADGILPLLEWYPHTEFIKPEMIQETVEVVSRPCDNVDELHEHMGELVADLAHKAEHLGLRLCGAGTHPFSRRMASITPRPRYMHIEQRAPYLAKTRITFATHVHVGLGDPDQMMAVKRDLVPLLPLLIGLSANSPFWHGSDTAFASYRQRALASISSYGIPPTFDTWGQFQAFFAAAKRAGMFEKLRDIHWDIRPQPTFGTVEVRTMDATSTIAEASALAALIRTLVAYLCRTPVEQRADALPSSLPWWALRENHFRASHAGVDARCMVDADGAVEHLRRTVERVLEILLPTARAIGESEHLERLVKTLNGGLGYQRQRRVYRETGSTQRVCQALADELAEELANLPDPSY